MKDGRRAPFCWQTIAAMAVIRERFTGEERRAAVAIYQAMTEVANELRHAGGRDGFEAPRRRIADYAGVTVRTLDKYVRAFEAAGVLQVEHRRDGRLNLPNIWRLVEPDGTGATNGGSANDCATPGQPTAPPSRNQQHHPGATNSTPLQEVEEKEELPLAPSRARGNRQRDHQRFERECRAYAAKHFPDLEADGPAAVKQASENGAIHLGHAQAFIDHWWRRTCACYSGGACRLGFKTAHDPADRDRPAGADEAPAGHPSTEALSDASAGLSSEAAA